MYRVYDKKEKKWIKDEVYLDPYENLYILKKRKLALASSERYVYHDAIGMSDKYGNPIFNGDIVEAEVGENEFIMLLVYYTTEMTSYVLLDIASKKYYTINPEKCKYIRIMGNVFDTPLPEEVYGEETNEEVSEKETTEETINN